MMRLDRYVSRSALISRSEAVDHIRRKHVRVDGIVINDPGYHLDETCEVSLNDNILVYEEYVYILLNKPAGVVTSTSDKLNKTVMDIIGSERKGMSPVGRLDKDTEGLLLITDNGRLAHNMLSPSKHVDKSYFVIPDHELCESDIVILREGVDIGDDSKTLPAKAENFNEGIILTIHEGRYHQIKRMLETVDNRVVYLKRLSFGPLTLDETISEPGQYRRLTAKEIQALSAWM